MSNQDTPPRPQPGRRGLQGRRPTPQTQDSPSASSDQTSGPTRLTGGGLGDLDYPVLGFSGFPSLYGRHLSSGAMLLTAVVYIGKAV